MSEMKTVTCSIPFWIGDKIRIGTRRFRVQSKIGVDQYEVTLIQRRAKGWRKHVRRVKATSRP